MTISNGRATMQRAIGAALLAVPMLLAATPGSLAQTAPGAASPAVGAGAAGGAGATGNAAASPGAASTLTGEGAGAVRFPTDAGEAASVTRTDYPTTAIADYVFACMATNGETRTALQQCSCSFDVVASIVPYQRYVEASTWLSMGQVTGEKGSIFRESAESKAAIGDLRRAQAEAEIRCFE
ncbi:hypothetical protein ATO4_08797 [Aurantimonas sp. 22II-16-19i]|nr:hypothetical protein ATO4_08797 [Aurantimonas sp. 22II-16-19i]